MAGMVHANDVRVAEGLRDIELPADPALAMSTWNRTLNDAVDELAPGRGARHPRPQRARRAGDQRAVLPLLPALLRAADVQQRVVVPVPPARTGGDADGDLVAHPVPRGPASRPKPTPPEPWECDDPRWPPIPAQDFSNLPRQQTGPAREGLRVHAPVRAGSRATSRTSSGPSTASSPAFPTSDCCRRCSDQRVPLRQADRRPRILSAPRVQWMVIHFATEGTPFPFTIHKRYGPGGAMFALAGAVTWSPPAPAVKASGT